MSVATSKFGLLGASLGTGNRGVSALGASVVKLVAESAPGRETFLLIGYKNENPFYLTIDDELTPVPVVSYRMSPRAPLSRQLFWILFLSCLYRFVPLSWVRRLALRNAWVRAVTEAQQVGEIRGGDSFSDIYGLKRFVLGSLPVLSAIWLRGKITLLPQTYGPYKSSAARALARYILRHAEVILSRDRASMKLVEELIGPTDRCRLCPDVAFSLQPIRPQQVSVQPPLPTTHPRCVIGLNINGLMFNGGYTRSNMFGLKLEYPAFLDALMLVLLEHPEHHVLLVPHTFAGPESVESDPHASRQVMARVPPSMAHRVHLVDQAYDQSEIKWVIGLCDFFVGSRMHACVAALSQGIPAVGIAYSKKFHGVFESVGAGDWVIDGRDTEATKALARVRELLEKRAELKPALVENVAAAQKLLREEFRELLGSGSRQRAAN
jgi:polysaccharide pyruvyl transferase WcaK-like protein